MALAFSTSWDTATGKTSDALTDGQALTEVGFPADLLLEVVDKDAAHPAHWPDHGLAISFDGSAASMVAAANAWPAPEVGQSIYYRFLLFNALPAGGGVAFEHGMQSNIGDISYTFQLFSPDPGSDTFSMGWASHGLPGDDAYMVTDLPAATPLRVEWALHREPGDAGRRPPRTDV